MATSCSSVGGAPSVVLQLRRFLAGAFSACLLGCVILDAQIIEAAPAANLVTYLEQHLGITEQQARGALGALLVFAQQQLSQDDFDQLAARIPNAQQIIEDVKLHGIVTHPLDDVDALESSLASLGIGQPLASQFPPAVLDYLSSTGHDAEHDILASILE